MKKKYLKLATVALISSTLFFQSCLGSFSLTHRVINWNNQVGSKFLNELVFVAFWILPVYEVTAVADLLVINSIEFWSGNNPAADQSKKVKTKNGMYTITSCKKGYKIKGPDNFETTLSFNEKDQTWSIETANNETYPFMTLLDPSHVKMIGPDGNFHEIELSRQGVEAYIQLAGIEPMAMN